ncbi:MAG TPA: CAP domain-containing protein [Gemmataceae bacterium]|jgi:uncharacterized protein YkwD
MIRTLSGLWFLALFVVAAPFLPAEDKKAAPKFALTKDEQTLLELLNKERAEKELPPLQPNPLLFQAARGHSANMAKQEKMEHILDGKNPGKRVLAAGYDYGKVAENIAVSDGPAAPLPVIVKGWMESKIHRENLLNDKVTETGLGIAKNDKGEVYYTQVFARPRKVNKPEKAEPRP